MQDWKAQLAEVKKDITPPAFSTLERFTATVIMEYLIDELKETERRALKVLREAPSKRLGSLSDYQLSQYESLIHSKRIIRGIRGRQRGLPRKARKRS